MAISPSKLKRIGREAFRPGEECPYDDYHVKEGWAQAKLRYEEEAEGWAREQARQNCSEVTELEEADSVADIKLWLEEHVLPGLLEKRGL